MKQRLHDNDLACPDEEAPGDHSESRSSDGISAGVDTVGVDTVGQLESYGIKPNDTKAIFALKVSLLLVLVGSALGAALGTYFYISHSEHAQFVSSFHDDASKLLEAIGSNIDRTLGLLDGLSLTMVSSAKAAGDEWPFVTLPNFGVRMSKILHSSKAIAISVSPIVTPQKRREWEAYSLANDYWVNESMAIQETWGGYNGPVVYDWEPHGVIHGDFDDIPYTET